MKTMHIIWNQRKKCFIELIIPSFQEKAQKADIPQYEICPLQWLLRTVSPYFAIDCSTVLAVRVPIPRSSSVSAFRCPLVDVIILEVVFPRHSMHVL
ncbi:hypothetical protein TNCV_2340911 [Trichonephila clavipes]|nr:hypothetical protein TNCV_2340911 [Trichonephila clavipes]